MTNRAAFDALITFGLDEKSASAYLGLLELQRATVLQLSRKTKLERSGLYLVMQDLAKRGLVHEQVDERGSKLYLPVTPTRLVDLEKERFTRLESSLPDLLAAYGVTKPKQDHPEVRWLSPSNTLEELYADIVSTCSQLSPAERIVHSIISQKDQVSIPAVLQMAYQQSCMQQQIVNRQVAASIPMSCSLFVYGHKVAFLALAEGYGMVFDNPALAYLQRTLIERVSA